MSGAYDLGQLLRELSPQLHPEPYIFVSLAAPPPAAIALAFGMVREAEGVTLVLPQQAAASLGLAAAERWAGVTLRVHSALGAVGMLAAVATALAADGISCNPLAGLYHDHLFVPWAARERAVAVLVALSAQR